MASKTTSDQESSEDKLPPPNLVWRFALAVHHEKIRMSRSRGTGQSAIAVYCQLKECASTQNLPYVDFQNVLYHHLSDCPDNYIDHIGTFSVHENTLLIEVHFSSPDQIKKCIDGLEMMAVSKALTSTFCSLMKSFKVVDVEVSLVIQSNIDSRLRLVTRENAVYGFSIVYTDRPSVTLLHLQSPEIYAPIKEAYNKLLAHFPNFLGEIDDFSALEDSSMTPEIVESSDDLESLEQVEPLSATVLSISPHIKKADNLHQASEVALSSTSMKEDDCKTFPSPASDKIKSDDDQLKEPITTVHPASNTDELDQEVSDDELGKIAPLIPPDLYKYLGNRLGLDSNAIDRIALDNRGYSLNFILKILTEANKLDDACRNTFTTALLHCRLQKAAKILDSSINIPPPGDKPLVLSSHLSVELPVLVDVNAQLYFYDKQLAKEHIQRQQQITFWKKFQRELCLAIEKALHDYGVPIHSTTEGSLIVNIILSSFNQAKRISTDIASRKLVDEVEVQMKVLGFTGVLAIQFKINEVEVTPEQCYEIYVKALLSNKPKGSHPLKLLPLLATVAGRSMHKSHHSQPTTVNSKSKEGHAEVNQSTGTDLDTSGLSANISTKHEKGLTDVIIHGTIEQIESSIEKGSVLTEYENGFLPLHIAAHYGKSEAIKALVSHGAEIEAKTATEEKVTSLHLAAYSSQLKAVETLVEFGADIEAPSANGSTPLRLAASQRNVLITEFLLEKGAKSNTQCDEKKTPLYAAIVRGHQGNVKLLLLHGADMTLPTITGETSIHHAIAYGSAEILSVLVSANPQALSHANVMAFEPPLISAVKLQKVEHVKILLKARADPNMSNKDQMSPLTIASCLENFEMMELLVKHGAEMMLTFPPFGTALHTVAVEGKVNATRKLLKMGMDPNTVDDEGTTPLRRAVENKQSEVAAVLLKNGADIHVDCPGDELPLFHKAAKRNDIEMLKVLIEHGVDPYETGIKGGTAMITAAAYGSADVVDLLSSYPRLIDIANKTESTPLMVAINKRHYDCALHLLKHRPNVSLCDSSGNTVLHTCIAFRAPEDVVQAVLSCDATIANPASNGVTPIMLACKHGFFELVGAMLEKNRDFFKSYPNMSATLLCAAADAGSTNTLEALLQHGAKPDSIHPHMPFTALHLVCTQRNAPEKMLQILLDHHPDLNIITELGAPLHVAVARHNNTFVAMLLRNGADPNALSIPEKVSPLITAAEINNLKAAQLILQHGGRIDHALASNGFTALHKAASANFPEIAQLLIKEIINVYSNEALARIDQRSKDGYTPLQVAVSAGSQEVFALLIENNSDMNAQDNAGVTPLMRAISEGRNDIALMLLELGANVQLCGNDGVNALHICARVGSADIATRILELGANPDVQERNGITPLLLSVMMQKIGVATVLVEKGASVDLADTEKNTPLHIAAELNDGDAVKLLLDHGADPTSQDKDGKKPKDLTGSKNIEKMMVTAAKEKTQTQSHSFVMEEVAYREGKGQAALKDLLYNVQHEDDGKKQKM